MDQGSAALTEMLTGRTVPTATRGMSSFTGMCLFCFSVFGYVLKVPHTSRRSEVDIFSSAVKLMLYFSCVVWYDTTDSVCYVCELLHQEYSLLGLLCLLTLRRLQNEADGCCIDIRALSSLLCPVVFLG